MTPYEEGLIAKMEIGAEAAQVLSAPVVTDWMDASEANIIDALLGAPPGQDGHSAREGLVAQLRTIRQLRTNLTAARETGAQAQVQYRKSTTATRQENGT